MHIMYTFHQFCYQQTCTRTFPITSVVVGAPSPICQSHHAILPHHSISYGNTETPPRRPVFDIIFPSLSWPHLLLTPFTVPYRLVFERPEDSETWPYHLSLILLTVESKSSYGPISGLILLHLISSFVTCSVCDMLKSLR